MNRQQKRATAQRLRKNSAKPLTFKEAQRVAQILDQVKQPSGIVDGDKVTLDYDKITATQQYTGANPEYKKFVEDHKGEIFTAKKPENRANKQIFELAEDPSGVKWLFWGGHLKKVEMINNLEEDTDGTKSLFDDRYLRFVKGEIDSFDEEDDELDTGLDDDKE